MAKSGDPSLPLTLSLPVTALWQEWAQKSAGLGFDFCCKPQGPPQGLAAGWKTEKGLQPALKKVRSWKPCDAVAPRPCQETAFRHCRLILG